MACGTGKTVTGVWATKDLKAQFVAVFVPNLGLLDQTFTDWKLNQVQFEALIVGSDKSVGYDDVVSSVSQLVQRATTDVEDIKAFALKDSLLPKVIFSTYQSSLVVGEALNQTGMTWTWRSLTRLTGRRARSVMNSLLCWMTPEFRLPSGCS